MYRNIIKRMFDIIIGLMILPFFCIIFAVFGTFLKSFVFTVLLFCGKLIKME